MVGAKDGEWDRQWDGTGNGIGDGDKTKCTPHLSFHLIPRNFVP